jgi:hypothetical protein
MGRQIRMVPPGWKHPKDGDGKYIPLLKGSFADADAEWNEEYAAWQRGEIRAYGKGDQKWEPKCEAALACDSYTEWSGRRPSPDEYMPPFPDGTATMLMMYEDTSEGTPISPAFETPEELARWLADTGASAFGGMTATYDQWLATCKAGWSVGMVMQGGKMMSGVEFEGRSPQETAP